MTAKFTLSASLAALALAAVAMPAHAAEAEAAEADAAAGADAAAAAETSGLTDIVVTATKRETNLQKTPISISVMGSEDIKKRHVQSLIDLADGGVPSLRVATFEARQSALTIGIRGIVPLDANQPAREQGVGVYLDGVYLGRQHGLNASLFDLERIEVLKGPQGTLFGRNTEGGALSMVVKAPTGEFGGRMSAGVGNYGSYTGQLHLDLPEFANIAIKLDGVIQHQDPTVKNPLAGQAGWNQYHRYGGRIAARWKPVDGLTVDLAFDKSRDENTPFYSQLVTITPAALANKPAQVVVTGQRMDTADIGVPQQPSIDKTQGFSANVKYKLTPDIELRSITSWRTVSDAQWDNSGGAHRTPIWAANTAFSRYSLAFLDQRQFSQEFQAVGSLGDVDYVAGLYYFNERANDRAQTPNSNVWNATLTNYTIVDPSTYLNAAVARASIAYSKSYAAYGQATWSPLPILHLTAGGRYTHDKKNGRLFVVNGAATPYSFALDNQRFDPLAVVAFDVSSDVNLYAKYATGYRAGGASSRSLTYRSFGPESVKSYEVGLKTTFLDRKVRFNIAGYIMDRKDSQVDFNAFALDNVVGSPTYGQVRNTLDTVNALGITKIRGVEADLTVTPVTGLSLGLSYAYTYSRVPPAENTIQEATNISQGNPGLNPVFQTVYIVFTPKNALSGNIDYELPVGGAGTALRFHVDGNYSDPMYTFDNEAVQSDKSFIVNARLSLADIPMSNAGQKLTVSAWARNLFNEAHIYRRSAANTALGDYANFNAPRTYGIEATVAF
ncbi:TonB-dependent receptor [Novosphingobium flavum]|uniref:TonB-dependent receptor n=1 Tax=Novosphingobium flavum TaxID=1778672 RepID=A0A7X1FTD4_9SPHN|nr:TonB-dependent receptor [Novosphingobium flavum]MBC2666591.1 TonB-dependent receptor [Novosphingobium flavum]